jgi:hypothetical protein
VGLERGFIRWLQLGQVPDFAASLEIPLLRAAEIEESQGESVKHVLDDAELEKGRKLGSSPAARKRYSETMARYRAQEKVAVRILRQRVLSRSLSAGARTSGLGRCQPPADAGVRRRNRCDPAAPGQINERQPNRRARPAMSGLEPSLAPSAAWTFDSTLTFCRALVRVPGGKVRFGRRRPGLSPPLAWPGGAASLGSRILPPAEARMPMGPPGRAAPIGPCSAATGGG